MTEHYDRAMGDDRYKTAKQLAEQPLDELRIQFGEACEMVPADHLSPFIGLALVERVAAVEAVLKDYQQFCDRWRLAIAVWDRSAVEGQLHALSIRTNKVVKGER